MRGGEYENRRGRRRRRGTAAARRAGLPGARRAILKIAALYIGLRYGPHASVRRAKELRRLVRELRLT